MREKEARGVAGDFPLGSGNLVRVDSDARGVAGSDLSNGREGSRRFMYQASQPSLEGAGAAGVRKARFETRFFGFLLGFALEPKVLSRGTIGVFIGVFDVLAASR